MILGVLKVMSLNEVTQLWITLFYSVNIYILANKCIVLLHPLSQPWGADMQRSLQACAACVYGHTRHLPSVSYKGYQTGRAA